MAARFDPDEMLSRNPQIDLDRLEEGRELLRRLRENGVRRKEYDLAPPFGGRRAPIQDDAQTDPRLARLKQPDDTH